MRMRDFIDKYERCLTYNLNFKFLINTIYYIQIKKTSKKTDSLLNDKYILNIYKILLFIDNE